MIPEELHLMSIKLAKKPGQKAIQGLLGAKSSYYIAGYELT